MRSRGLYAFLIGFAAALLCGFGLPGPQGAASGGGTFTGGTLTSDLTLDTGVDMVLSSTSEVSWTDVFLYRDAAGKLELSSTANGTTGGGVLIVEDVQFQDTGGNWPFRFDGSSNAFYLASDVDQSWYSTTSTFSGAVDTSVSRATGGVLALQGSSTQGIAHLVRGQEGYCTASGEAATVIKATGVWHPMSASAGTQTVTLSQSGTYNAMATAASGESDSYVGPSNHFMEFQSGAYYIVKFSVDSTSDMRVWFGIASSSTMFTDSGDDHSGSGVGGCYRAGTDTNWQAFKDTGTISVTDQSVAPASSTIYYGVVDYTSASSATVALYDDDFDQLWTETFTTGLPTGSDNAVAGISVQCTTSTSKTLNYYWARVFLRD